MTVPSDVCPKPKVYSAAVQSKAATELAALPQSSIIGAMIADYGVLRAESRACAK